MQINFNYKLNFIQLKNAANYVNNLDFIKIITLIIIINYFNRTKSKQILHQTNHMTSVYLCLSFVIYHTIYFVPNSDSAPVLFCLLPIHCLSDLEINLLIQKEKKRKNQLFRCRNSSFFFLHD